MINKLESKKIHSSKKILTNILLYPSKITKQQKMIINKSIKFKITTFLNILLILIKTSKRKFRSFKLNSQIFNRKMSQIIIKCKIFKKINKQSNRIRKSYTKLKHQTLWVELDKVKMYKLILIFMIDLNQVLNN